MAEVQATVGANITPYMQQMAKVRAIAKQTSESIGVEGLKGERALHTQIEGFFKDIANGGNIATSALSRLGDSFRLSAGALVAFVAVQKLFEMLQSGYEASVKFRSAVQDSLTIDANNSIKSVEQLDEEIIKLKQDAKDSNVAAEGLATAGAETLIQAFIARKSFTDQAIEDAEKNFNINKQLHDEEDAAADRGIAQANEIIRLKIAGKNDEADLRRDELADQNKLLELQRHGDDQAIADLNAQIQLKKQLREIEKDQKEDKEADSLQKQIDEEKARQAEIGKTPEQKLKDAKSQVSTDVAAEGKTDDLLSSKKAELQLEKDITKEKELQAEIAARAAESAKKTAQENFERFKKGNELEGELRKKRAEAQKKLVELKEEEAKARSRLVADQAESMGFHGQVSSLRREGFGRTPASSGDNKALKAAQESKVTLDKIHKEMSDLNKKIGGSA